MTVDDPTGVGEERPVRPTWSTRRLPRLPALAPGSPVRVYLGVTLIVAGFATIAYTWGRVAGLGSVPLQLPYLVSGGLTAIGLILVGLTVVNIAVLQRDAEARERQVNRLVDAMDRAPQHREEAGE